MNQVQPLPLNLDAARADMASMNSPVLALLYLALWASLFRAMLVRAQILPPTCGRCGLRFERRQLGELVCSCSR